MKNKTRTSYLVLCALLPLAACDLQPRIVGAFDGGNGGTSSNSTDLYGRAVSQQYGAPQTAANMYGTPTENVRFANRNDYTMPAQSTTVAAPIVQSSGGTHTVVAGETLHSIARAHGTDWKSLAAINNLFEPYRLSVGQKLQLLNGVNTTLLQNTESEPVPENAQGADEETAPGQPSASSPSEPPVNTTVDDVLLVPARVAAAPKQVEIVAPTNGEIIVARGDTVFGLSQKHNVPLRDLLDANDIKPPYTLRVGQKLKLPSARIHTVVAGDTLYSISRRYSVDLNSLAQKNNLREPFGLAVGQRLQLPATVTVPSAPAVAPVVTSAPTQPVVAAPAPTTAPATSTTTTTSVATPKPTTPVPVVAPPPRPAAPVTTPPAQPAPRVTSTTASGTVAKLPATPARASQKFSWPVTGRIISDFGAKSGGLYNDGINIAAKLGTTVKAAENGVVAYAGNELRGMGNLVIINHSGGWMTVYAHMDTITVRRGAKVSVGEKIGTVGQTGRVNEPQLHFEIRNGTRAFNPRTQLK
ncbi:MAG: LysM peptidoglycan-binding domain-containing protein [Alphaproteobacteria bacterium]|nr:LysM peptidoglycan-binding domain-containing protein [Alphaproteobacteria bacterium]MCL2889899.1 LysM peptidoglycan-binding domain-containing protein [Alphaproteobacteria bacterium]